MKKKLLIALLTLVSAGALATAACQPDAEKHVCEHECPICGKCLDETCTDEVCADKCEGHEEPSDGVKVTKIIVNTDDENNDGTINSPYLVPVTQGQYEELTFNVQPSNADNKTFNWKVGTVSGGEFTENTELGITASVSGSKLTITAANNAQNAVVQGVAADGSGVSVYLSISVQSYTAVTSVTSSTLAVSENDEYDYELRTALYTNWDLDGGMLQRGKDLLNGTVYSGYQAPRNITYYANVYNFGITVAPSDASNKDVLVSYSNQGIVSVDATTGALQVLAAGETVVTVASESEPEVAMKVKVTVEDSLYRGITMEAYEEAEMATNTAIGWDLDPGDKASEAHLSAYDDWHLVMVHTNDRRGTAGIDGNQKIFYMGSSTAPYGVSLENNVMSSTGGSLDDSASMMWAKVTIPTGAITFNVKLNNNDKTHGQYRVLFVDEDGTVTVLSNGWESFATATMTSFTEKFTLPDEIKGKTGAMVIEHRVTQADNNAELHVYVMKFEGQVDVTGIAFEKTSATYKAGARTFSVKAVVKPDNATNDKVTYAMEEGSAAGVTVNATTGEVTITDDAEAGDYVIIATSVADQTKTARFTLTLTADEVEIREWTTADEILNGVEGVKWDKVGLVDSLGEGASIRGNGTEWRAISLANRQIKSSSFILTFGARTFVRSADDQEPFGKVEVRVINEQGTTVTVRAIGMTEDSIVIDTDNYKTLSYDLSAFIGQTVTIQIGVAEVVAQTKNDNCHTVIKPVKFTGNDDIYTSWANKDELKDPDHDAWELTGSTDAGVGEGFDIKNTGTYISNSFVIGNYNALFTFGGRVFHRDNETYPYIKIVVVTEDGTEHVIRAQGAEDDTVYFDTDAIQYFSYDLSEFIGQLVEIRIQLANNATHCVITSIKMENAPAVEPELPEGPETPEPENPPVEGGEDNEGGTVEGGNTGDEGDNIDTE